MRLAFLPILLTTHVFGMASLAASDEGTAFFEKAIRPLLAEHCYECHSVREQKQKGGLLLDSRADLLKGGDSGAAIVPGKPEESLLLRAVSYHDFDLKMPPDDKLAEDEIEALRHWITLGAPDPRDEAEGTIVEETIDYERGRQFWAFVRPAETPLPKVTNREWPRRAIDHYLLSKMESTGHHPAPGADRRTLIRRLLVDLIGLPPTVEEIHAFINDDHVNAYERLTDRLLASPNYGERWGRHWLDIARYSDSNGMDENIAHPQAYRYRDYVVDAFNEDKPYDQFVVEQLAGDLLTAPTLDEKRHQVVGLGFLSVGPKMLACDDPDKMRRDIVDEQLDTMGRAFMGMTLGCARCHDHKFDPISIEDYYGLAGIFLSTKTMTNYNVVAVMHEHDLSEPEHIARRNEVAELAKRRDNKKTPDDEKVKLKKQIAALEKGLPQPFRILGVTEYPAQDTRVHLRGNYLTLGETVPRRVLPVIAGSDLSPMPAGQSGRLELARWLTNEDHPLTARVIVNRLWRWHFGRGIVTTPDNFGKLGTRPTHPELLDFLAIQLMEGGWSLKRLQREILLSAMFRQSAKADDDVFAADPENALFARWESRRVEAEVLRDAVLDQSGRLDRAIGGQLLTDKAKKYVNKGKLPEYEKSTRRTIYLPVIRSTGYDGLTAFDFADPSVINGNRRTSTVTPQALYLMNGSLIHESAAAVADRVLKMKSVAESSARVVWLTEHLTGRQPSAAQIQRAEDFLTNYSTSPEEAWAAYARTLFASNAYLYID